MARLTVHELNKSFGSRTLFEGLSFEVGERDRIGLVGVNGCGKTTLMKLFTGEDTPDKGSVVRFRDTRIGYMEQHTCRDSQRTLWDEVQSVFEPVMAVERELNAVNRCVEQDPTPAHLEQQHRLREQFENMGGLYYKSRVRSTLLGLGFTQDQFATPVGVLSGGQRSKTAMGKLLLADTNLLLLDEPTNHLDIPSVEWLEEYLQNYTGAMIVISHDRYFLDKVTTRTMELHNQRLFITNGNYSAHREKREKDREVEEKHYQTAMQEIHRLEDNITLLKQWNREKSIRAAESREKRVERLRQEVVAPDKEEQAVRFHFTVNQTGGNEVLHAEELQMGFSSEPLFANATFGLNRGERVFLLGPNGCGKTTLLRLLCGELTPQRGSVRYGAKVTPGYYDQIQQGLDESKTAIDELWDAYPTMTETQIRSAMATFLFRGDDVYKTVAVMSGGERARLLLLKLMLAGDNLLLLDEPTNHLDIASREALENALADYEGTILAVSHDRYFINRMATRVLELKPDGIHTAGNNYDAYTAMRQRAVQPPVPEEKPKKENDYTRRKEWESNRRRLQTAIRRSEEKVERLETEITGLQEQLSDPTVSADYERLTELSAQLEEKNRELEETMQEWEIQQEQWETLEGQP